MFDPAKPTFTTRHGVLYKADCLEVLRRLNGESVNTVFADPPSNIGKDYKNGFNDKVAEHEYFTWCNAWITECARVLKPGGAFFLYATPELAVRFAAMMGELLTFRHWIALTMKGTFPRGKKLYPAHYALLYYTRGEPSTFNKIRLPVPECRHCGGDLKDYGGHRSKLHPDGINLTDFWEDTSPNRHKKFKVRDGVNELKLMIPERAILMSTNPGDLVLDPFGGGGSTFQAAEMHHRNWLGTELYDTPHIATRLKENFPFSAGKKSALKIKDILRDHEDHEHGVLRGGEGASL